MHHPIKRPLLASAPTVRARFIFGACVCLVLAALACTSNDTLFIHLTATPIPSATPTRAAITSRFQIGDQPTYVAPTSPGTLLRSANETDRGGGLCFTATQVTIADIAQSGKTTFYKVRCASVEGWTTDAALTRFKVGGGATVRAESYLTSDPEPDFTTNRAAPTPCKADQAVSALDLAISPADNRIYVSVQCGAAVGWIAESALQ